MTPYHSYVLNQRGWEAFIDHCNGIGIDELAVASAFEHSASYTHELILPAHLAFEALDRYRLGRADKPTNGEVFDKVEKLEASFLGSMEVFDEALLLHMCQHRFDDILGLDLSAKLVELVRDLRSGTTLY